MTAAGNGRKVVDRPMNKNRGGNRGGYRWGQGDAVPLARCESTERTTRLRRKRIPDFNSKGEKKVRGERTDLWNGTGDGSVEKKPHDGTCSPEKKGSSYSRETHLAKEIRTRPGKDPSPAQVAKDLQK